jgi:hypothetical protein
MVSTQNGAALGDPSSTKRLSLAPRFGGAFAYLSDMRPREPKSKLLTGTDYDSGWRR